MAGQGLCRAISSMNRLELEHGAADGEFAFDLEPDDKEEKSQQPVVDPVQQRHAERRVAEREAERALPPLCEFGAGR